jgi:hypothetical protein
LWFWDIQHETTAVTLLCRDRIFGAKYYVKRLQLGVIRQRATIQSFENQVQRDDA